MREIKYVINLIKTIKFKTNKNCLPEEKVRRKINKFFRCYIIDRRGKLFHKPIKYYIR